MNNVVISDRVTFMQRLQDCASKGLERYVNSSVSGEKLREFQKSMTLKYELDMSDSTRSKRRKSGEAVGRLYVYQTGHGYPMPWVMMVSPGEGRIPNREQLKDIRKQRLTFGDYELVHDGRTWSWQMTKATVQRWNTKFCEVAKYPSKRRKIVQGPDGVACDQNAEALLDALYTSPGFRLVRRQIGHIVAKARTDWSRFRPKAGPSLEARVFLPYIRRRPNKSV